MKRYLITVIFAIAVIVLYHFLNIRLFNFDLTRIVRESLFRNFNDHHGDDRIMLFNIGKLDPNGLAVKIDSLLLTGSQRIGINLCHWNKIPAELINKYKSDDRIVFANCKNSGSGSISEIISADNAVTHFRTDRKDYFEMQLTGFKGRGNDIEMINYEMPGRRPQVDLDYSQYWFNPEYVKDRILLVGYMGDYLTFSDNLLDFKNSRVTPLNREYSQRFREPDMYDIQISANIISTITGSHFIEEVGHLPRVFIVLLFSLLNVLALTFMQTRWTLANLTIATLLFILLTAAASFLLVIMFGGGIYLNLDELPLVLLITTVFTVILNISQKRKTQTNYV